MLSDVRPEDGGSRVMRGLDKFSYDLSGFRKESDVISMPQPFYDVKSNDTIMNWKISASNRYMDDFSIWFDLDRLKSDGAAPAKYDLNTIIELCAAM